MFLLLTKIKIDDVIDVGVWLGLDARCSMLEVVVRIMVRGLGFEG